MDIDELTKSLGAFSWDKPKDTKEDDENRTTRKPTIPKLLLSMDSVDSGTDFIFI